MSLKGLLRTSDLAPGIRRMRKGKGFRYTDAKGKPVKDEQRLARIKSLVIPPAWKDVWICAAPRGHLQAVGFDAKGRKQYRYHPLWRKQRDIAKYEKMVPFAEKLPAIRLRVEEDLKKPGLPREKVLAAIVRLLEETLIRIGNEEYVKENESYGLTTMLNTHVKVKGTAMEFKFKGKSGKHHDIVVEDPEVAKIVKRCRALPGDELFEYIDEDGGTHDVKAADVNAYLHDIAGDAFTAKDFRTWSGTVHAALLLSNLPASTVKEAKRSIVRAIEQVASALGNTPAVCRKSYVHPLVLDRYTERELHHDLRKHLRAAKQAPVGLSLGEMAVLDFLREWL